MPTETNHIDTQRDPEPGRTKRDIDCVDTPAVEVKRLLPSRRDMQTRCTRAAEIERASSVKRAEDRVAEAISFAETLKYMHVTIMSRTEEYTRAAVAFALKESEDMWCQVVPYASESDYHAKVVLSWGEKPHIPDVANERDVARHTDDQCDPEPGRTKRDIDCVDTPAVEVKRPLPWRLEMRTICTAVGEAERVSTVRRAESKVAEAIAFAKTSKSMHTSLRSLTEEYTRAAVAFALKESKDMWCQVESDSHDSDYYARIVLSWGERPHLPDVADERDVTHPNE